MHDKMLHLSDGARVRMGRSCIKYFKVLYGVVVWYAPSKNAGISMERMLKGRNVRSLGMQKGVSSGAGWRRRRMKVKKKQISTLLCIQSEIRSEF